MGRLDGERRTSFISIFSLGQFTPPLSVITLDKIMTSRNYMLLFFFLKNNMRRREIQLGRLDGMPLAERRTLVISIFSLGQFAPPLRVRWIKIMTSRNQLVFCS